MMNRQNQNRDGDDLASDPNLLMAMAFMNSINSNANEASKDFGQSLAESMMIPPPSLQDLNKTASPDKKAQQELIEKLSPIEELAEKIRQKRIIPREEVNALTIAVTRETTDVKKYLEAANATRLGDFLQFVYFVILNIQPFSQGKNFLESQTLHKLVKESFGLIKGVLDLINGQGNSGKKKEDEPLTLAALYNTFIGPALKILALFSGSSKTSQTYYDTMHYKYLRSTNVKFSVGTLTFLNQLLTEVSSEAQEKSKAKQDAKQEIQLDSHEKVAEVKADEDFLFSTLEFLPKDYKTLASSLQAQLGKITSSLQQVDDEAMSMPDEEEKGEVSDSIEIAAKDIITKLKLVDAFAKAIDKLVTQAASDKVDFFLALNSQLLFGTFRKYSELVPGITPKSLDNFLGKVIVDRALKSQENIIEHFGKAKDLSSIMQMEIDEGKNGAKELQELTLVLGKSLEIMGSDGVTEVIKAGQSLKYLSKLISIDFNKGLLNDSIQMISMAICKQLQATLTESFLSKMNQAQILEAIVLVSRLVIVNRSLNEQKSSSPQKPEQAKPQFSQPPSLPENKQPTNVRTRNQAKKDSENSQQPKNQDSQQLNLQSVQLFLKFDVTDLLKVSMSLLSKLIYILKSSKEELALSAPLLSNLFDLAKNDYKIIGSLIFGTLSEFCKPGLNYSKETVALISQFLVKKMKKITKSALQSSFALKLVFILSNKKTKNSDPELAFKVAEALISDTWVLKKGQLTELCDSQNLPRLFLLMGSLLALESNSDTSHALRTRLLKLLSSRLQGEAFTFNLSLVQLCLLHSSKLALFKPALQTFLTTLLSIGDFTWNSATVSTACQGLIQNILSSDNSFDPALQLPNMTTLQDYLEFARSDTKVLGEQHRGHHTQIIKQLLAFGGSADFCWAAREDMELLNRLKGPQLTIDQEVFEIKEILKRFGEVADQIEQERVKIIREHLSDKMSQREAELATSIIMEVSKCRGSDSKTTKTQLAILKIELPSHPITQLISLLIDPKALSTALAQARGTQSKQEDFIYAHYLSQYSSMIPDENGSKRILQEMISNTFILKSMSNVLQNFVTKISESETNEELKKFAQEVIITLLKVRQDNPVLELQEAGYHNFDYDSAEKLVNRLSKDKIAIKDYIRLRQFDQALYLLITARASGATAQPQLLGLINDYVSSSSMIFAQLNVKQFLSFLKLHDDLGALLRVTSKTANLGVDLSAQLWQEAFAYLQMSGYQTEAEEAKASEVNLERKGGVQLAISFNDEKRAGKGGKGHGPRKRELRPKRNHKNSEAQEEKHSQEIQMSQETKPQKKQRIINPIALSLIQFLCDGMKSEENSSTENKEISEIIRQGFTKTSYVQSEDIIQILAQTKQSQLAKQLLSALCGSSNQNDIRARLTQNLIYYLKQEDSPDHLLVLDLSQLLAASNADLFSFLTDHLLPSLSIESAPSLYLQALDFLCQLVQSRFQGDDGRYNQNSILTRRIKQQKLENARKEKRNSAVSQKSADDAGEEIPKNDAIIEGFKQDKVEHDDKDQARYMEKPDEICTYSQTKKEFRDQHWYHCYTCKLTDNSGCCAVCARKCHKGHVVVYSRRSNFFCDCGDSGRCKCLQGGKDSKASNGGPILFGRPDRPDRPGRPDPSQLESRSMLFGGREPMRLEREAGIGLPPGAFGNPFGQPPPDGLFNAPFGAPPDFLAFDNGLGLGQIDGIQQQMFMQMQQPPPGLRQIREDESPRYMGNQQMIQDYEQYRSGSSDGQDDDNNQDRPGYRSQIRQMMRIIEKGERMGGRPPRGGFEFRGGAPYGGYSRGHFNERGGNQRVLDPHIVRQESEVSLSQISSINPLEDPLSDGALSVTNSNDREGLVLTTSSGKDDEEMEQPEEESKVAVELIELLKSQHAHFDQVFNLLVKLVDNSLTQSQNMSIDEISATQNSQHKRETSFDGRVATLLAPKEKVVLAQDISQNKKTFNSGSFSTRISNDNLIRTTVQNNINILNIIDSNKDGLVAICQDQEVGFYSGSQFFEDLPNKEQERFPFNNLGLQLNKISGQSLAYQPLQVLFNPVQPYYVAVAGIQNVDIIVLDKQGKFSYKISLNLMLEAISRDLTIVNIRWLPNSPTSIAVGTRDFIKIYDLGEDLMSPTHNIQIFNGLISDFAFSQKTTSEGVNRAKATVFGASKQGAIYYQEISYKVSSFVKDEGMSIDQDNSELMMTEALKIDPSLNIVENKSQCLSLYLTSQDILLSTFSDGITLCGKVHDQNYQAVKLNLAQDPSFNSSPLRNLWQRYGESIVGFREIAMITPKNARGEQRLYLSAFSRRPGQNPQNTGIPLVLEIKETKVNVHVIKNPMMGNSNMTPIIGQAWVKSSHKQNKNNRLVNLMIDGSGASFMCKQIGQNNGEDTHQQSEQERLELSITNSVGNVDQLISRSDLPHEVSLSVSFFEKQKSLNHDANLRQKLTVFGDIIVPFRNSKAFVDQMPQSVSQHSPFWQDQGKRQMKFQLKLDSNDYLVTGMRLRLDFTQSRNPGSFITLKLFNRTQKLNNYGQSPKHPGMPLLFDVPFCDAEVLFGSSQYSTNLSFELLTDDPKQCPIRIVSVEIFCLGRKEFGYKDKMRKLEKMHADKIRSQMISLAPTKSTQAIQEESIKAELLKTKARIPIVSWKEKALYLASNVSQAQADQVQTFDVLTQYLSFSSSIDKILLHSLLEKVKLYLNNEGAHLNEFVNAAGKRCLRKIFSVLSPNAPLGDPLNYETMKDTHLVQEISSKLQNGYTSFSDLNKDIRKLSKMGNKRFYHMFQIIGAHPGLIESLIQSYCQLFNSQQSSKETQQNIQDLVNLFLLHYHQALNSLPILSAQFNLEDAFNAAFAESSLSQVFDILTPLLTHQEDIVKKMTVSNILASQQQFANTMQKSLKTGKTITANYLSEKKNILLVDFGPHFLEYLRRQLQSNDLAYQLFYKVAKRFESNCLELFGGKFIDRLVTIIASLIKEQVIAVQSSELKVTGDEAQQSTADKSLYLNVVLVNIFLQKPQKEEVMKIKSTNLRLDQTTVEKICAAFDVQSTNQIIQWVNQTLNVYSQAFKAQQCSFKTKIEEGIPSGVIEQLSGKAQGNGLLRPISMTENWVWHPLFLNADSQFDLLDRKIPSQLMLFVHFFLSQLQIDEVSVNTLVQTIKNFAFNNPAKKFLKSLGELSIRDLLMSTRKDKPNATKDVDSIIQKEIIGESVFEEFFQVYDTIYTKNIYRKGQAAISYNLQFLLHQLLKKVWNKACNNVEGWMYFITQSTNSKMSLINKLYDSIFVLNDDTAQLCLQLVALAFDETVVISFRPGMAEAIQISLFTIFSRSIKKLSESKEAIKTYQGKDLNVDFEKLIDVMLLGRNQKSLRIAAGHILKGIYDTVPHMQSFIKESLMVKIPQLRTKGVNSLEFIALLSYIVNRDIEINGQEASQGLYKNLSEQIYKQVSRTNQQLVAHENLELYATLQRVTNSFHSLASLELPPGTEEDFFKKLMDKDGAGPSALQKSPFQEGYKGVSNKITNPYLLETEACQRCFSQRSLPFNQQRLQDLKIEAKYTDSKLLYRLNGVYTFKQIQIIQDGFRGNKAMKEVSVYINNKQTVDLAEMKNNMQYWKKVKTQSIEIEYSRYITIDFTLPVTAQNIMIEFNTVYSSKQHGRPGDREQQRIDHHAAKSSKKVKKTAKIESVSQVAGIDSVLMTLPKQVVGYLGIISKDSNNGEAVQDDLGNAIDQDKMMCPRCNRIITGRHGICNSCGENGQQCHYCRHINHEKPDAFLCTECGMCRYCKFEISVTVKPGYACEKIDSEESRLQASQAIEQQLQQAQKSYQVLMTKRQTIQALVKKLNEGSPESGKIISDQYTNECAEEYQRMMKALSTIKTLKMEINSYTQDGIPENNEEEKSQLLPTQLGISFSGRGFGQEEYQQQENCFSCIQEYLKGLLSFIQVTADRLAQGYTEAGFIDLLYKQNLKMYTSALQDPARKAICSLVRTDENKGAKLLQSLADDLFSKKAVIPAHLLSSNINQETYLILDLFKQQSALREKGQSPHFYPTVQKYLWILLFKALSEGGENAAIADQVAGTLISHIKELIKNSEKASDITSKEITQLIIAQFNKSKLVDQAEYQNALKKYLNEQNFLIYSLTLNSSQRVRTEAKEIINQLSNQHKDMQAEILRQLLSILDRVLSLDSSAGDQYFDLLSQLLSPSIIKEKISENSLKATSENYIYVQAFEVLFKLIDKELLKLIQQENQRSKMGSDGFIPQISTGQIFSRVVSLVSSMIKESIHLKGIIQQNVNIVIKSFLKIRKLNLTKNRVIQNSETEIEKMFKELHSEKEEEKANFILQCIKLIQTGDCDHQEMRFLFEEICKVIDPVKPEPEYKIQLKGTPSQQDFLKKMQKSSYTSNQLGKTMNDIRNKIGLETDLDSPELLELLVDNKIISLDLTVKQVYEQVHWPAVCRQRNPDAYDIPNIDDAPRDQLAPMIVVYRLTGFDGEATEDRVESLQDASELEQDPTHIQKKYGYLSILSQNFASGSGYSANSIQVLAKVLYTFGSLIKQRYLAEWLFKLIGFALKVKQNLVEFLKEQNTVDTLAKRLFESVGMQSNTESSRGATLFDIILSIMEQVIVEVNKNENNISASLEEMEIDHQQESSESAAHVELFIKILSDSCDDMVANGQGIDKTSKKIKAVSKILPFLINKKDKNAQAIMIKFIGEALTQIPKLDNLAEMSAKEKFIAQFNLERVIEILDSIPVTKNYLKDQIVQDCGMLLQSMWNYMLSTTLADLSNEAQIYKHKSANSYSLRILLVLYKNHPQSQSELFASHRALCDKLYELTQSKYKDRSLIILAQDVVIGSFTNNNNQNDADLKDYFQKQINKEADEKKRLAQKKREEIMRQMQAKKDANKFIKQVEKEQDVEENGPKCIVCQDGYTKKPTEVLGMYVFSKRLKICEVSEAVGGFSNTAGSTTVTHSNFIHFTCHQNAHRADQQLKHPKKEWEGAAIRNDHTKCNNLFPLRGGNLRVDDYSSVVDRYFSNLQKQVGSCDGDRIKVLLHDFKMLMKRLAYEDSFSRDTHGGGPEHNMRLVPFMIQMAESLLRQNSGNYRLSKNESQSGKFTFHNEKRLDQFLEQGMQMKKDFLSKLEEVKKAGAIDEEEKHSQSEQDDYGDQLMREGGANEEDNNMSDLSLDQIAFMLVQCLVFCQMPRWESYKYKFFSIILCTVANMKDDKSLEQPKPIGVQSDFATGKRVLTISKSDDIQMVQPTEAFSGLGQGGEVRKRRLSSDNRSELLQRALFRARPLLVLMRLVDSIKRRWDAKRLGIIGNSEESMPKQDDYLKRLNEEFIAKGNLQETINECDELFKDYKDHILKISSVEEFLQDMGMLDTLTSQDGITLEQFIQKHFAQ